MNRATVQWVKKSIREMQQRIIDKNLSTEKREKAFGELAKLAYYLLEA